MSHLPQRKPIVIANWKMNGSLELAKEFSTDEVLNGWAKKIQIAICPPFPLLLGFASSKSISVGSQDLSRFEGGAHTGEVSGEMIYNLGCRYAVVGHSERRQHHHETDSVVVSKISSAHRSGLIAVICVGETKEERKEGLTERTVEAQIEATLKLYPLINATNTIYAYEPLWAIGSGNAASPAEIQHVHAIIRKKIGHTNENFAQECRIIYGGSLAPDNAAKIMAQKDVDGGLVGGAALEIPSFIDICQTTYNIKKGNLCL